MSSSSPSVPAGRVPHFHPDCAEFLRRHAASMPFHAAELDVFEQESPPPARGAYEAEGMRCPHGVRYWWLPSSRQIAAWERAS